MSIEEEVKGLENKELLSAYEYYEPRKKVLGKEEKQYLEAVIKEINLRRIG